MWSQACNLGMTHGNIPSLLPLASSSAPQSLEDSVICLEWMLAAGWELNWCCWLGHLIGPLNIACWLPHSSVAASQERAFQKGQVEAALPFMTWFPWLYWVSCAIITGPSGLERKGHIFCFLMEECQCYLLRKVCSRGYTEVAVLGKYTLLQGTGHLSGRWSQEGAARRGEVR